MFWVGCYIEMSLLSVGNYLGNFAAEGIAHADSKARVSGSKADISFFTAVPSIP
jgi:hypothetical protein